MSTNYLGMVGMGSVVWWGLLGNLDTDPSISSPFLIAGPSSLAGTRELLLWAELPSAVGHPRHEY